MSTSPPSDSGLQKIIAEIRDAQLQPGYRLHDACRQAEKAYSDNRRDGRGIPYPDRWIPHMDLRVSKEARRRVLLLIDAIIRASAKVYGCKIVPIKEVPRGWDKPSIELMLSNGKHSCAFDVREPTKRSVNPKQEYSWQTYIYTPTGRLNFSIKRFPAEKSWSDQSQKLEERLVEMVESLPDIFARLERYDVEKAEAKKREAEEHRQWQKRMQMDRDAKANISDLLRAVDRCARVREISAFLDRAEREIGATADAKFSKWLWYCRWVVGNTDPFVRGEKPWEAYRPMEFDVENRTLDGSEI